MQTAAPTNEVYYDFTSMPNVESLVSLGVSKGNPPRVIVYVLGMDTCCDWLAMDVFWVYFASSQ